MHIDLIAHMAINPANETADFPQLQTLAKKRSAAAAIVLTTAPQVSWLNRETADEFQAIFFHSSLPRKKTEVKWKRCRWSQDLEVEESMLNQF